MEESNIFTKNEKRTSTFKQNIRVFRQNVGIEFGIEKCVMFTMKEMKK